jgi:hypothetical protein
MYDRPKRVRVIAQISDGGTAQLSGVRHKIIAQLSERGSAQLSGVTVHRLRRDVFVRRNVDLQSIYSQS